jgi:hypothetical protein
LQPSIVPTQVLLMPILVEASSKQRIARSGQGKRSGYRTIMAYRAGERSVFLYGFGKNERDNIDGDELARWKIAGRVILEGDADWIVSAIADGYLTEVQR